MSCSRKEKHGHGIHHRKAHSAHLKAHSLKFHAWHTMIPKKKQWYLRILAATVLVAFYCKTMMTAGILSCAVVEDWQILNRDTPRYKRNALQAYGHVHLVGMDTFKLSTDHKPLIALIKSRNLDSVPVRCQRHHCCLMQNRSMHLAIAWLLQIHCRIAHWALWRTSWWWPQISEDHR